MGALRRAKEAFDRKSDLSLDLVNDATRALRDLGWVHDLTKEEPLPEHIQRRTGKMVGHPWWVSPQGDYVRGWANAVRAAHRQSLGKPSPMAARVLAALRKHPEVLAEVRDLLNEEVRLPVQLGTDPA